MAFYYPVENQNEFKELACVLHHAPNEMVITCKLHGIIDDNSEQCLFITAIFKAKNFVQL